MLPSMTEILCEYWVGGLLTKSTYGSGVPLGCNAEIPDFSDTCLLYTSDAADE